MQFLSCQSFPISTMVPQERALNILSDWPDSLLSVLFWIPRFFLSPFQLAPPSPFLPAPYSSPDRCLGILWIWFVVCFFVCLFLMGNAACFPWRQAASPGSRYPCTNWGWLHDAQSIHCHYDVRWCPSQSGSCTSEGCRMTSCFNSHFSCSLNRSNVFETNTSGQQKLLSERLFLEAIFTNGTNALAGKGLRLVQAC